MTIGVDLSSSAKTKLRAAGVSVSEFNLELSETISDSYLFGRDVSNNKSDLVRHIHFVPISDSEKLKSWNDHYKNGRKSFNRVSNDIVFYTMNSTRTRCLVIEFISPHGHSVFSNIDFLQELDKIANAYVLNGIIP
jgi:hypothetical protein